MEVFWAQGYEATGVTDLLEQLGIARQSMYNAFGNKRSLFLQALRRYLERFGGAIIAELQSPGPPLENIRKALEVWQELAQERSNCGCLAGNTAAELGPHDPEVAEVLRTAYRGVVEAFADALDRAQREGTVAPGLDANSVAGLIVAAAQGAALLNKVYGGPDLGDSVLNAISSILEQN